MYPLNATGLLLQTAYLLKITIRLVHDVGYMDLAIFCDVVSAKGLNLSHFILKIAELAVTRHFVATLGRSAPPVSQVSQVFT